MSFFRNKKTNVPVMPVDVRGIYSIYDNVSHEFSQPWLAKNDDIAIRTYRAQISASKLKGEEESKKLGYNPFSESDFILYSVGTFDVSNGNLSSDIHPVDSF